MESSSLVSIIVPVYNVEAYLPACIDSLLAQTYKNIEIFLVDDGSPDRCPAICDEYAASDLRVRVIHKENGGAASARNVGLDMSKGDYICFVDSDDLVHSDYIEKLISELQAATADIAVCGFTKMTKLDETVCTDREKAGIYTGNEYVEQFLAHWTCSLLWNKIFRRESIGTIYMEEGHCIDDEFFTYQVVLNCKSVVVFDTPLYRYRLRSSSIMKGARENSERIYLDRIDYMQKRYEKVSATVPALQAKFFCDLTDSFVRYWLFCKEMPAAEREIRQWAKHNVFMILKADIVVTQKLSYLYALFLRKAGAEENKEIASKCNVSYFD